MPHWQVGRFGQRSIPTVPLTEVCTVGYASTQLNPAIHLRLTRKGSLPISQCLLLPGLLTDSSASAPKAWYTNSTVIL